MNSRVCQKDTQANAKEAPADHTHLGEVTLIAQDSKLSREELALVPPYTVRPRTVALYLSHPLLALKLAGNDSSKLNLPVGLSSV